MKIFPVVHINNPETAVEQANLAYDEGADGVYLIDHRMTSGDTKLFNVFNALAEQRGDDAYLGVNLLGLSAEKAMVRIDSAVEGRSLVRTPDGLWSDDTLSSFDPFEAYRSLKNSHVASMRFLGGVTFKYTDRFTENPDFAASDTRWLSPAVDVVTTSGKGTGSPPSVAKIAAMKLATDKPLAVASGISLENIADYEGIVDEILAASSVETESYSGVFDPVKLRALIAAAHSLS